mgnify:CR=1 FL=1
MAGQEGVSVYTCGGTLCTPHPWVTPQAHRGLPLKDNVPSPGADVTLSLAPLLFLSAFSSFFSIVIFSLPLTFLLLFPYFLPVFVLISFPFITLYIFHLIYSINLYITYYRIYLNIFIEYINIDILHYTRIWYIFNTHLYNFFSH